ncbi:MAG: glycosyltransferase family 2 protein [Elusimicrobia bacterium]|nr:glycosyltransferase family 2 protein [Elusimicrobiota bacterium]
MNQILTKVSIIIPVYNVEQYLKQCLDSVINQTFKDIEIIVINDCSPDNSLQIIKDYQQKDNRIVLIDLKQNVGIGLVRNEGLKIAKGKYVTFIDSDDWIANNYVEVLYNTIEKYQYDVISPNFYSYDETTKKLSLGKQPQCFYNINISNVKLKQKFLYFEKTHYLRKIFKLDFLRKNNIVFHINKLEDTLFVWEVLINTNKFMFIKDKLYYYRTSINNSFIDKNTKCKIELQNTINLATEIKKVLVKNFDTYKNFKPVLNSFIMNRLFPLSGKYPNEFKKSYPDFKKDFFENEKIEFYHINTVESFAKIFLFKLLFKFNINIMFLSKAYNKLKIMRKK